MFWENTKYVLREHTNKNIIRERKRTRKRVGVSPQGALPFPRKDCIFDTLRVAPLTCCTRHDSTWKEVS